MKPQIPAQACDWAISNIKATDYAKGVHDFLHNLAKFNKCTYSMNKKLK